MRKLAHAAAFAAAVACAAFSPAMAADAIDDGGILALEDIEADFRLPLGRCADLVAIVILDRDIEGPAIFAVPPRLRGSLAAFDDRAPAAPRSGLGIRFDGGRMTMRA